MSEHASAGDLVLGLQGLTILRSWLLDPAGVRAGRRGMLRLAERLDEDPWSEPAVGGERTVPRGYAEWASTYDAESNPAILAEEPVVRSLLARHPPGPALDAACGTGRHSAYLRALGHEVTGIDASAAMLGAARAKVPGARLLSGDLAAIPLAGGAVDLAVCALALTHLDDPAPALSELARVVRPGGSVILSDIHPFMVLLGGHAAYRTAEGAPAFVRNAVHLPSHYLRAFGEAGLAPVRCLEPRWGERAIAALGFGGEVAELVGPALRGLPIVIVWELERAR